MFCVFCNRLAFNIKEHSNKMLLVPRAVSTRITTALVLVDAAGSCCRFSRFFSAAAAAASDVTAAFDACY